MHIAILGAGAWGTSLALTLSRNGHAPALWTRTTSAATELKRRRENTRRLPGLRLPAGVMVTGSLDIALRGAEALLVALPAPALPAVIDDARLRIASGLPILCCTRGLYARGALTPLSSLAALLPQVAPGELAVLGGPLLASDLARDRPATAVIAGTSPETVGKFRDLLTRATLEISTDDDVAGVELAAAYKSVVAVTAGLAEALGYGEAARGVLVMRGYAELVRLGAALGDSTGIRPQTLAGPAGLGDLVLGCTSPRARDWQVGYLLGRGLSVEKVHADRSDAAAEIAETVRAVLALGRRLSLETPLLEAAQVVLSGRRSGQDAVLKLVAPSARRASVVRPLEPDLFEVDEIDEGGETLANRGQIQAAEAIEAEVLDAVGSQHRAEDHRGANVRRGGAAAVGQPAHESAREGVARAGWVDDGLDREGGGREDATLVKEQGASIAALDHDGARPEGADHAGGGGQVRKP